MKYIKKHLTKIIIMGLILISILVISLKYNLNKNKEPKIVKEETIEIKPKEKEKKKEDEKNTLSVDIKGAIKNPGVYDVNEKDKIIDVVKIAGGLTDNADTTYINLAKKVTDEMVIIIYTDSQIKEAKRKETLSINDISNSCVCPKITNDACINKETTNKSNSTSSNSKENNNTKTKSDNNSVVNINTATIEELQTLPGVGESKAKAIITYREENGNFTKPEDIQNVSGIGESLYEKIKDHITV